MKNLRINARVLVYDNNRLLLVRNRNANFWYPPGGGWEHAQETIQECAIREIYEETGYRVHLKRMLWTQELRDEDKIYFEIFWLAALTKQNTQTIEKLAAHIDHDPTGMVEEAKWFKESELQRLKVFPEPARKFASFTSQKEADVFLGVFP